MIIESRNLASMKILFLRANRIDTNYEAIFAISPRSQKETSFMKTSKNLFLSLIFAGTLMGCVDTDVPKINIPDPVVPEVKMPDLSDYTDLDFKHLVFLCNLADETSCSGFEAAVRAQEDKIEPRDFVLIVLSDHERFDINLMAYIVDANRSPNDAIAFINKTYTELQDSKLLERMKAVRKKFNATSGCRLDSFKECSEGFEKLLNVPEVDGIKEIPVQVWKQSTEVRLHGGYSVDFSANQQEIDDHVKKQVAFANDYITGLELEKNLTKNHGIGVIAHRRLHSSNNLNFSEFIIGLTNLQQALADKELDFKGSTLVLSKQNEPTSKSSLTKNYSIIVKYDSTPEDMFEYLRNEIRGIQ